MRRDITFEGFAGRADLISRGDYGSAEGFCVRVSWLPIVSARSCAGSKHTLCSARSTHQERDT